MVFGFWRQSLGVMVICAPGWRVRSWFRRLRVRRSVPVLRWCQPGRGRGYLCSIGHGERPLDEVVDAITDAEERLARLRDSPAIAGSMTGCTAAT